MAQEPDSDEELDEFLALGKATEEGEEGDEEEDEGDDLQEKMAEDVAVSESYLTSEWPVMVPYCESCGLL